MSGVDQCVAQVPSGASVLTRMTENTLLFSLLKSDSTPAMDGGGSAPNGASLAEATASTDVVVAALDFSANDANVAAALGEPASNATANKLPSLQMAMS